MISGFLDTPSMKGPSQPDSAACLHMEGPTRIVPASPLGAINESQSAIPATVRLVNLFFG